MLSVSAFIFVCTSKLPAKSNAVAPAEVQCFKHIKNNRHHSLHPSGAYTHTLNAYRKTAVYTDTPRFL